MTVIDDFLNLALGASDSKFKRRQLDYFFVIIYECCFISDTDDYGAFQSVHILRNLKYTFDNNYINFNFDKFSLLILLANIWTIVHEISLNVDNFLICSYLGFPICPYDAPMMSQGIWSRPVLSTLVEMFGMV